MIPSLVAYFLAKIKNVEGNRLISIDPKIPEIQSNTSWMFVVSKAIVIIGPVIKTVKNTVHLLIYGVILCGITNFIKLFLAVMINTGNAAMFRKM